jgi:hypothetical protein
LQKQTISKDRFIIAQPDERENRCGLGEDLLVEAQPDRVVQRIPDDETKRNKRWKQQGHTEEPVTCAQR